MNSITVPIKKINSVSFDKEMYEESVYNYMRICADCGGSMRTNISFSWKEDNAVPTELLEFISQTGIDVNLSGAEE